MYFFKCTTVLCFWETHCTLATYNSELSDCSFTQCIFNSLQSGVLTGLFWLLQGWCHLKLMPSSHRFWVYNAPVYSVIQSHIYRVHVCLAIKCHQHCWQNERDLLRATATTQGWNRGKHFPATSARNWTQTVDIYIHICLDLDWIHWHCQWQDHFWHMYMQREEMRRAQIIQKISDVKE